MDDMNLALPCSFLGYVDLLGTTYSASTLATGYGSYIALPLLRKAVEGREHELTEEEGVKLIEESMKVLFYRDARSLNKVGYLFMKLLVHRTYNSYSLVPSSRGHRERCNYIRIQERANSMGLCGGSKRIWCTNGVKRVFVIWQPRARYAIYSGSKRSEWQSQHRRRGMIPNMLNDLGKPAEE